MSHIYWKVEIVIFEQNSFRTLRNHFVCFSLYIYEYLMIDRQNYLLRPLDKPLTSQRRRLSSTDDIPIILLTFCTLVCTCCAISITRLSKKLALYTTYVS